MAGPVGFSAYFTVSLQVDRDVCVERRGIRVHVCVCFKGGENKGNVDPGRISIPFVGRINNSEASSIGKSQTSSSCLSWSGLEAHGWMNKDRQSSCVLTVCPLPFSVPAHHNHLWTLTRLFASRRVLPRLHVLRTWSRCLCGAVPVAAGGTAGAACAADRQDKHGGNWAPQMEISQESN